MDDALVTRWLLAFFGACVLGPALGALVGRWAGFSVGVAIGTLVIGLTGLTGAGVAVWEGWKNSADSMAVPGRLIEFEDDRPVVEFTSPDGATHRITGLGGSQPRAGPGDEVPVRLPQGDAARARIDDLQNASGLAIALGLFGLLPTLFGVFFTAQAVSERRGEVPPRPPTPAQRRRRTQLTVIANVVFLGGFAVSFLGEDLTRSLGAGFMIVGGGGLLHFIAQSLPPAAMPFHTRFIFVVVGVGFAAFGLVARLLGG
ncbi:DUF3592 domain-containing protein [Xenophilus sp.]|uniref:DUF3592 domain-containing protein n=1 Tax=Xenophilus sp. TaxID=1873499 RepID=UPI0037DD0655